MRRRRLKKLWRRLGELRRQKLSRDQLLIKIGAAKKDAGRAYALVDIHLPKKDQAVTPETFTFALRKDKLRIARRREGQYLLRTNLSDDDPAHLWRLGGGGWAEGRPRRVQGPDGAGGSTRDHR